MKKQYRSKRRDVLLSLVLLMAFCFSGLATLAEDIPARRVFMAGDTESFPPDADILNIYIAPLLGADCLLLGAGGEWMFVDMGKESDYPVIREMLVNLGIGRIDIAFNTHPHSDHIGSMSQIAAEFEVGRFITTYPLDMFGPSIRQRPTLKVLNDLAVPVETMADGDQFSLGKAGMKVLKENNQDVNASSASLHICFGDTTFLLAADISRLSQERLAKRYELAADVLKYPHHGQEKLNQSFSEEVNAEFAVFTHGSLNTLAGQKWLDRYGIAYVFASWGLIHIQSDGQKIIVSQQIKEDMQNYQINWEKKKQR